MFEEITMSTNVFVIISVLAILGFKYIVKIINAIINTAVEILRGLWKVIAFIVSLYVIYYVLANISFS